MKKEFEQNKGITLIALIITIIILLILVGVSINLAIKGDLFGSAQKAVSGTNAKVEEQQTRIDELMGELENAMPKPQVQIITFKIGDKIYQAEEGMNWYQWVDSSYNTEFRWGNDMMFDLEVDIHLQTNDSNPYGVETEVLTMNDGMIFYQNNSYGGAWGGTIITNGAEYKTRTQDWD